MTRVGLTPAQCRAARSAVGMSQKRLAEEAEVSLPVVQEFEGRGRTPLEKNLRDIRDVLASYGVQFQVKEKGRAVVIFADENAKFALLPNSEPGDDE